MTSLLPDVVSHAVDQQSVMSTTGSFGVVAVILLIALLVQLEMTRTRNERSQARRAVAALAGPLFVAVIVVVSARFTTFIG